MAQEWENWWADQLSYYQAQIQGFELVHPISTPSVISWSSGRVNCRTKVKELCDTGQQQDILEEFW